MPRRCPVTELAAFPPRESAGEEALLRHKTKENILEISFDRKADTATGCWDEEQREDEDGGPVC